MSTQQRIISALFVVSLLLLAANIVIGKVFQTENTVIRADVLSDTQIDSLFRACVKSFGIQDNQLKKRTPAELKRENEDFLYELFLPKDLPIPSFLYELNGLFSEYDVTVSATEKKISGRTILTIQTMNELALGAGIDYHPNINREVRTVGFLLTLTDKTDKNTIEALLNTPEPFAFIFTPSLVMSKFISSRGNHKREYAIVLGDATVDLDYKFDPSYSERRLKSSVRNLLGAFPNAAFFIIDDNSSFYKSRVYSFVENEFFNRNIRLIMKSELASINTDFGGVSSNFNEIMDALQGGDSVLIAATPDEFTSLIGEIKKYRKVGYKFIIPSDIVFAKK